MKQFFETGLVLMLKVHNYFYWENINEEPIECPVLILNNSSGN